MSKKMKHFSLDFPAKPQKAFNFAEIEMTFDKTASMCAFNGMNEVLIRFGLSLIATAMKAHVACRSTIVALCLAEGKDASLSLIIDFHN